MISLHPERTARDSQASSSRAKRRGARARGGELDEQDIAASFAALADVAGRDDRHLIALLQRVSLGESMPIAT
jgi:hypothetical protein